jgi:hypothetical protein
MIIWGRREDSQHVQHEYLKGQVLPGGRRYLLLSSTRIPGTMLVQPSCRRARGEKWWTVLVPRQATFALFDACAIERTAGDRQAARCKAKPWLT